MVRLLTDSISPSAQTVLDVGCNEGVFARALAERGYFVIGIEGQQQYASTAVAYRDSNRTPRLAFHNKMLSPEDVTNLASVDVILLLSVHHQWVATYGLTVANGMLIELASKARQQFFFSPACIRAKYGKHFNEFEDNDYAAIESYFRRNMEAPLGRKLRFLGTVVNELPPDEPSRPLFVLEVPRGGASNQPKPNDSKKVWLSKSDVFDVNLAICRIGLTQSPHPSGWCYLSACVKEAENIPTIKPEQSILAKYYNKWNPANLGELLFPENPSQVPALTRVPTRFYSPPLPWTDAYQLVGVENAEFHFSMAAIPDHEFHAHGPISRAMLAVEHRRMINLWQALRQEGYTPEIHHDGYIRGYFLVFNGEERFMVTGGQHRAGILGAMQSERLRVKFEPTCQREYNFSDVEKWPAVRSGLYTMQDAHNVLTRIFSEDGNTIGRRVC